MFLYRLNHVDRLTFLRMAKRMALTDDGLIDVEEESMLSGMANEMGLSLHVDDKLKRKQREETGDILNDEFEIVELERRFQDNTAKKICLVELIGLGYANKNFDASQSQFIKDVARSFGIKEKQVKRLEEWVVEILEVTQEGEQLIKN